MSELETLDEAKQHLRKNFEDGCRCPCCDQLVKLYRRKLHAEMALFLIKLVRAWEEEPRPYHVRELVPSITKSSTDGAYLAHWGLLTRSNSEDERTRGGIYAPTEKGIAFVHGQHRVPSHVHLLYNKVMGWADTQTDIVTALGDRFDYWELMRG